MLTLEKNGTRSRMLSICRNEFNNGRRSGRALAKLLRLFGVAAPVRAESCVLIKLVRTDAEWKSSTYPYWERTCNFSQLVHHGFGEPVIWSIDSINCVCDKDPLMAAEARCQQHNPRGQRTSHLEFLRLKHEKQI
jgi:hypothetical protein